MLAKLLSFFVRSQNTPLPENPVEDDSTTIFKTFMAGKKQNGDIEMKIKTYSNTEISSGFMTIRANEKLYPFWDWLIFEKQPGDVSGGEQLSEFYDEYINSIAS